MAVIKEILGHVPQMGENCFLAETAAVIGDVTMGDNCSIWYGTVLRGAFPFPHSASRWKKSDFIFGS